MGRAGTFFAAVLVAATLLKLALAFYTYGTNDVMFYSAYAQKIESDGGAALYRDGVVIRRADGSLRTEGFANPPLILHLLRLLKILERATGLAFPFLLRLPAIFADIGTALLVWNLLPWLPRSRDSLVAACVLAGSPVLVMISGFHGSTDPVIVFFLMWCAWLLQRSGTSRTAGWLAGLAFGIAISIKVWPAILLPVPLMFVRTWPERIRFVAIATGTFVIAGMPILAQDYRLVLGRLLRYESVYGMWGFSRFVTIARMEGVSAWYREYGRFVAILISLAAAFWAGRRFRPHAMLAFGFVVSVFLIFTPGFGIQYLCWILPWLAALGWEISLIYSVVAGVFIFQVYSTWSSGIPWHTADSTFALSWSGFLIWHEVFCWLVILASAGLFVRASRRMALA